MEEIRRELEIQEAALKDPDAALGQFLDFLPGNRVLDVGCGAARYAGKFSKRGLDYVGIDLSPLMIEVARSRHPSLRFEEMSFRKLSFPDASFDGIWCCCALHYESRANLPGVLSELRRVLSPEGVMSIIMPLSEETHEGFVGVYGAYLALYTPYDFEKEIANAGFKIRDQAVFYESGSFELLVGI